MLLSRPCSHPQYNVFSMAKIRKDRVTDCPIWLTELSGPSVCTVCPHYVSLDVDGKGKKMIVHIELGWHHRDEIKKLPLERQRDLARLINEDPNVAVKEDEDGHQYLDTNWYGKYVVSLSELKEFNISFTVKQVFDKTNADLIETMNRLDKRLQASDNMVHFNQRCSVHVSGLGLMRIKEVHVENDCCTDRLQQMLNDGWRIVAACVQPNQRRPDYVLGRSKAPG